MKSIVVVPTYNESQNVGRLLERLSQHVPDLDVMFVDDNSPDGTGDLIEREGSKYPGVQLLRRAGQRGLGRSYRDGFQRSLDQGYDRVVQMDADLSHDPAYLPAMLEASGSADLVIGSRYCCGGGLRDWPLHRRLLSKFAVRYVRHVARINISDATAGFRCWTRRALELVDLPSLQSDGYAFQVEMSYRAVRSGLTVREIPIIFTDRTCGKSKISKRVLAESMTMPWRFRRMDWRPPASANHEGSIARQQQPRAVKG